MIVKPKTERAEHQEPQRRRNAVRLRWEGVAAWLMAVASLSAVAQTPTSDTVIDREYTIKAGFLYHFSTYIEWPADAFPAEGEPFVIGVYGTDPFGTALEQIAQKKNVAGRTIEVRHVSSVKEALDCHILYVPKSVPRAEQDAVVKALIARPILDVGETDDFVARGGNVQLFVEGNKVRFAFGEQSHDRDNLKISSKLLSLAKMVPSR